MSLASSQEVIVPNDCELRCIQTMNALIQVNRLFNRAMWSDFFCVIEGFPNAMH